MVAAAFAEDVAAEGLLIMAAADVAAVGCCTYCSVCLLQVGLPRCYAAEGCRINLFQMSVACKCCCKRAAPEVCCRGFSLRGLPQILAALCVACRCCCERVAE